MPNMPILPPQPLRPPALLVGGVRSGCGKTTLTLALLAALRSRNIVVQACKAGPDFIDPAHHAAFTGQPSYNLDAWMGGPDGLERAFAAALHNLEQSHLAQTQDRLLQAGSAFNPAFAQASGHNAPPLYTPADSRLQKMLLIEGVMGLFDGAASSRLIGEGEGSTAEIARRCGVPVLLVVDVRGLAQSAAAIIEGFVRYRADISFTGIICTHVGGLRHQHLLRETLALCEVPLLGMLPRADAPHLPSRHLGLLLPHEIELQADTLANWLEKHMDIDALLRIVLHNACGASTTQASPAAVAQLQVSQPALLVESINSGEHGAPPINIASRTPAGPLAANFAAAYTTVPSVTHAAGNALTTAALSMRGHTGHTSGPAATCPQAPFVVRKNVRPRIAIAHDEAFCFLYPDFPTVLTQLGAETLFFSPLHDTALPPCEALYLPGGYPELFAERLSTNIAMREAIHSFADKGGTIYGECGGYMYMMDSISITTDTGTTLWPMTACLPLACRLENKRVALGYREARPAGPQFWGKDDLCVRGHEYHYTRLLPQAAPLPPLWKVNDAAGKPLPDEGTLLGRLAGSWLHLYPQGARPLLTSFIQGLRL